MNITECVIDKLMNLFVNQDFEFDLPFTHLLSYLLSLDFPATNTRYILCILVINGPWWGFNPPMLCVSLWLVSILWRERTWQITGPPLDTHRRRTKHQVFWKENQYRKSIRNGASALSFVFSLSSSRKSLVPMSTCSQPAELHQEFMLSLFSCLDSTLLRESWG